MQETGTNGHIAGLLSAADILDAEDIQHEYVDMRPYWPGTVKVKSLTGEERNKVGALMRAEGKKVGEDEALAFFQTRIVAASLIDEDGKRLFTQADVVKLARKSAAAIQRAYAVAARLSGLGEDELEEAKAGLPMTPNDDIGGD